MFQAAFLHSSLPHLRVLVFGTFDHLHPGHRFLLSEASKRACPPGPASTELSTSSRRRRGELHVVIARDANVERIKGRKSDQQEGERLDAISALFPDAIVVLGDPRDFLVPIHTIKPDLILLGYDQELPPGVKREDIPCPTERLPAFEPEKWKSSFRRNQEN